MLVVKLHNGFVYHTHNASSRFVVVVILCILYRRLYVLGMVVLVCDACVFAVMRFSTELWYRRIYGLVSKHIRTVVFCGY